MRPEPIPGFRCIRSFITSALLSTFVFQHAAAQTEPTSPASGDTPLAGDATLLPTFNVSSEKDKSYTGHEALSLTRTGVELSDLPQSVIVINKAYIEAMSPPALSELVSYVGGGQTGNISWGIDRFTIRGFTSQGDFLDGFLTINTPPTSMSFLDHIEIIKGPAAIMSTNAQGAVGGAVNKVSKNPTQAQDQTLTVEAGRYDARRAALDVGGSITKDKKLLWRLLVLGQDQKGYFDYTYDKRTSIMPMLEYNFNSNTDAWIKFEKFSNHYSSYNGIPLDGRTNQPVAVPATTNFGENTPQNWREFDMWRLWGQFTHRPADFLAIRLAAFDSSTYVRRTESVLSPSGATTPTLQPDGSLAFLPYPQYTIAPTYVSGQLINRATTADYTYAPRRELQNDYAFNFNTGPVENKFLVGGSLVDFPQVNKSWSSGGSSTAVSSPINPINPTHPGTASVNYSLPPTNITDLTQTYAKVFALETASFLKNRVILNYGVSRHRFDLASSSANYNQNTGTSSTSTVPDAALYKNLVQYGIVVKPLPNVSLFYGRNSNFSANPIQNGQFLPPQEGSQKETGVKTEIIPGKLNVTISYFEIFQINNSLPAFPQTTPPTQVLVPGETSRGFDGDFSLSVTKNLSIVGSFAMFKAHVEEAAPYNLVSQPYDGKVHKTLPVSNVSQTNFAAWASYRFTGSLKGFSAGLGVNTVSKRAIADNANQIFYGYIPAYTMVNANAAYETKHFKYQLNVDNVLNRSYYFSARSNQVIVPGIPINPRISVTYKY